MKSAVATYVPSSYMEKYVTVTFGLYQTLGFVMKYELWQLEKNDLGEYVEVGDAPLWSMKDPENHAYTPLNNTARVEVGPLSDVHLTPGGFYRVKLLAVPATGEAVDGDGNPIYLGTQNCDFSLQPYAAPVFYLSALPAVKEVDGTLQHSMTLNITDGDAGRSLVDGQYMVRVYKPAVGGTPAQQVWPAAGAGDVYWSSSTPCSIHVNGLEKSTVYEVRVYGVSDQLNTGHDADGVALPGLATLTEEQLQDHLLNTMLAETMDDAGIRYGTMGIVSVGDKIRLTFDGAVGIDVVKKMTYSVTYRSGATNQNETKTVDVLLETVDAEEGAYAITLPFTMTAKVKHFVTIQLQTADGKVLKTISQDCYYW